MNDELFNYAITMADAVVDHLTQTQIQKGNQVNIAHKGLTDSFVNTDLADEMLKSIQSRLKEKGVSTKISTNKVPGKDYYQIQIDIL